MHLRQEVNVGTPTDLEWITPRGQVMTALLMWTLAPHSKLPRAPRAAVWFPGECRQDPRLPPQPHPQQKVGGRVQRVTLQFNRVPLIFPCRTEEYLQVHRRLWISLKVLQGDNGSFSLYKTNLRIKFVLPADTLWFECPLWCHGNGGSAMSSWGISDGTRTMSLFWSFLAYMAISCVYILFF